MISRCCAKANAQTRFPESVHPKSMSSADIRRLYKSMNSAGIIATQGGSSWAIFSHLRTLLGPSWSIVGILGASWEHLGNIMAHLGNLGAGPLCLTLLGPVLGHLGIMLEHLGPFWPRPEKGVESSPLGTPFWSPQTNLKF